MSAQYKVGSFTMPTSTGTQAITGVGFTPKAILFWQSGAFLSSGTWNGSVRQVVGFTSGASESYSVAGFSQDGVGTSDTSRRIAAKAITMVKNSGATDGEADLQSFDADGFTLNWTTTPSAYQVMYLAIGGDGVSAKVVNWTSPTSTGNKAVTGVGFTPDVVLHAAGREETTIPSSNTHMATALGAMDGAGGQWANSVYAQDGAATSSTARYQRTDKCLAQINSASAGVYEEAAFVSMDADGFTVNYTTANASFASQVISLCLSGVDAKVGNFAKTTALDRIDTSTAATATAYSNQRKVDRCQNGVLWAFFQNAHVMYASYSTDDGASWTGSVASRQNIANGGSTLNHTPNVSVFIDLDDFAHLVYKDGGNGFIYYRRGTPNAGRTAWTWSAATLVRDTSNANHPDIVVHREGTGWKAHVVMAVFTTTNKVDYVEVNITSGGTVSAAGHVALSGFYGNSNSTWPSIDFNHTGDGKTVAGSTPHLYAAWSAGATGSGNGIRFRKATYSGGSWTWGTERQIENRFLPDAARWLNCLFDGTRVVFTGLWWSGANNVLAAYERDAADTTTTTRVLAVGSGFSHGSSTYDSDGNLYFVSKDGSNLNSRKWVRATDTLETAVVVDASANAAPYVSAKRGYSNGKIEFIYTDGTSSPYNVKYRNIDTTTGDLNPEGVQQAITGVGFEPTAVLFSNYGWTASASLINGASWGLSGTDGTNERAVAQVDRNNLSTTEADSLWRNDKVIHVQHNPPPTTDADADLTSLDADGFTLNWTTNFVAASEILYLSFGAGASFALVGAYTGAAFEDKPLKRWDGAAWVDVDAAAFKRWDGAAWVQA